MKKSILSLLVLLFCYGTVPDVRCSNSIEMPSKIEEMIESVSNVAVTLSMDKITKDDLIQLITDMAILVSFEGYLLFWKALWDSAIAAFYADRLIEAVALAKIINSDQGQCLLRALPVIGSRLVSDAPGTLDRDSAWQSEVRIMGTLLFMGFIGYSLLRLVTLYAHSSTRYTLIPVVTTALRDKEVRTVLGFSGGVLTASATVLVLQYSRKLQELVTGAGLAKEEVFVFLSVIIPLWGVFLMGSKDAGRYVKWLSIAFFLAKTINGYHGQRLLTSIPVIGSRLISDEQIILGEQEKITSPEQAACTISRFLVLISVLLWLEMRRDRLVKEL